MLTSRPSASEGEAELPKFAHVRIDALENDAIEGFLARWCAALFPESSANQQRHLHELIEALRIRPEIRRVARNPLMLTALAAVHWHETRFANLDSPDLWVTIPAGEFRMDSQRKDSKKPNYDEEAFDWELSDHPVRLNKYAIGR